MINQATDLQDAQDLTPRLHRDDVGQADLQPDYVAAAV